MTAPDKKVSTTPTDETPIGSTISASQSPSLDITNSQKKDLNYLFKLDITKKKLEKISDDIKDLLQKNLELQDTIQYAYQDLSIIRSQVHELELSYKQELFLFTESLNSCGISDPNIVSNDTLRKSFLDSYLSAYRKTLSKSSNKFSKEEINELVSQQSEALDKAIDNLRNKYYELKLAENLFEDRKKAKNTLQTEIDALKNQYTTIENIIQETYEKYQEVDNQGLLMSYEFSGEQPTMKDFIASPEITHQLERLIMLCNHKEQLASYHIDFPKGVLLVGDQDVGKTFIAKVLSSEINRKMYHIKAHDLFSEESTDPNDMITDFFFTIIDYIQKNNEPCIIFLDEMEKIINSAGEYNTAQQKIITNTLIKNIINIQKSDLDIMIVGAVSNLKHIDPKLLKYDIFDNQFFLGLPKASERKRFFEYYIKKAEEKLQKPIFSVELFDRVVQKTDGFSAEYIKQIISSCVKDYVYQEFQLHTPSPIDEVLLIKKIDELKLEDRVKGTPRYFVT